MLNTGISPQHPELLRFKSDSSRRQQPSVKAFTFLRDEKERGAARRSRRAVCDGEPPGIKRGARAKEVLEC